MKKRTLSIKEGFARLRDAALQAQGEAAVKAMTGNPNFPNLTNKVDAVRTATSEFAIARANSVTGNQHDLDVKEEKRNLLVEALHELAVMINLEAKGERLMLDTTSFPFLKEPKTGRKRKENGLKLEAGKGSIMVSFGKISGAKAYLIQYAKAVVAERREWVNIHTSDLSVLITGLESGQEYLFRIAGIGKGTHLAYSDEISSFVL